MTTAKQIRTLGASDLQQTRGLAAKTGIQAGIQDKWSPIKISPIKL